jgi:hypothetical protein
MEAVGDKGDGGGGEFKYGNIWYMVRTFISNTTCLHLLKQ